MNAPPTDIPARKGLALVVIPCLNEETHIEHVVTTLIADANDIDMALVVADGGSTDRTRPIVQRLAADDPRIVLINNSKRIQAAGINAAVRMYGYAFQFLIRADAHANYPIHYCQALLRVQSRTQADSVVVSMRTSGSSCFQRAAATAQNSILGNGGSAHRNAAADRWVDHGHHALIKIDAFNAIGGYDETFSHNEDAEFDARLIASGHHIFHTGETQVTYYPRNSATALFRQYSNIGRGRARNFLKHRKNTKLRHLVLIAVAPACCLMLLAPLSGIFALPGLAWILLCLGYGITLGYRSRDLCAAAAGVAAIAMQAGWSFGFIRSLIEELLKLRKKRALEKLRSPTQSGIKP